MNGPSRKKQENKIQRL